MKKLSFSALLFIFIVANPFKVLANEESVDDFLDDILSSEVQEAPEITQDAINAESQIQEGEQAVSQPLDDEALDVVLENSMTNQVILEDNTATNTEDTQSVEQPAELVAEEIEEDEEEYAEYVDIKEYYNRSELGNGFFVYELSDGNESVLQNINTVSSFNPSVNKIIEIGKLSPSSLNEENAEVEVEEVVVEPAQAEVKAPQVVKVPSINSRTRGR